MTAAGGRPGSEVDRVVKGFSVTLEIYAQKQKTQWERIRGLMVGETHHPNLAKMVLH
jgi:hypothetical protein